MLSSLASVVMRSPPITNGYSRPNSALTFASAARIACAFSSLLKSVSGSLRNSVGISVTHSTLRFFLNIITDPDVLQIRLCRLVLLRDPLSRLLQLLDFSFHQFSFERAHLVEKHDAIAMVSLVQHATGSQFCLINFEFGTVDVVSTNDGPQATLDRRENSGKRKTTLFAVLLALNMNHFRIDHHDALIGILAGRAVHHEQPFGDTNLHRSQPHAGRRVHRLKHIANEFPEAVAEIRNRITWCVEYWIRPRHYFHQCHLIVQLRNNCVSSNC